MVGKVFRRSETSPVAEIQRTVLKAEFRPGLCSTPVTNGQTERVSLTHSKNPRSWDTARPCTLPESFTNILLN